METLTTLVFSFIIVNFFTFLLLEGEVGDVSPALSQRLKKSALILCKSAFLVAIYDWNYYLKCKF